MITAIPIIKSKLLVTSLVVAASTEAARANTIAKKNNTAAATAPSTVMTFTTNFGDVFGI
jgi:hypothetical protein